VTKRSVLNRRATYDDLRRVPDSLVAEILDGDLYTTPRPSPRHANASSVLGAQLAGPFHMGRRGPGGWWILDEPELHLREDVIVPDIAGWRRERLPALPDTAAFTLRPDWVCEVLSPSTEDLDRGRKLTIYAREEVPYLWLINPSTKTLETFALADGLWSAAATLTGATLARVQPFEAIELELHALWAT
jgi:Uma2 family endonuclease